MSFAVQTDGYEGPISLLLSLITVQKVDLWQLSIADLVDGYLAELDRMRYLDLEIATEFLVVASTLLELKCRRLFPNSDPTEIDEEFAFFEERDLLIARLLETKAYRDAASQFVERFTSTTLSSPRIGMLEEPFQSMLPDLLAGVTLTRLANSLERFLIGEPEEVDISHLPPHSLSISQVARKVVIRLSDLVKCTFVELMEEAGSRLEVVVGFLAILELYRQSRVEISQQDALGELEIAWTSSRLSNSEMELFLENSGFEV